MTSASLTRTASIALGQQARDIAIDSVRGRVIAPSDRGAGTPGLVQWTTEGAFASAPTSVEVSPEPSLVDVDERTGLIYSATYRGGILDIVDPASATVVDRITGLPSTPSVLAIDSAARKAYIATSTVTVVDLDTKAVTTTAISAEKYPLLKDMQLDAATGVLWIAEGRAGVVTALDLATGAWKSDVQIPISAFTFDGTAVSGRPTQLAVDEALGHLYVTVEPKIGDAFSRAKMLTVDTRTGKILGSPVELGTTVREIAVNATTHEVSAVNGYDNTLSVVDPATWTVGATLDFTAEGVTSGTGVGAANVWGLALNASTGAAYVSHPYSGSSVSATTSAVSQVTRSGAIPVVTALSPAPGQGADTDPTPEPGGPVTNPVFDGPAAPELGAAASGAVFTRDNTLSWNVSNYATDWPATVFGDGVSLGTDNVFTFAGGRGWTVDSSGESEIVWPGAVEYRQYKTLAPDVFTTFANPVLRVDATGTGTLSFDVAWGESATSVSPGYRRVVVATFPAGDRSAVDAARTLVVSPDYAGRAYVKPAQPGRVYPDSFPAEFVDYMTDGLRGWWIASGAGGDARKAPNPVRIGYAVTTDAAGPEVETPGTGEPGDPGTGEPGTGEPGTGEPGTDEPATGDPEGGETGEPGAGTPGTDEPSTPDGAVVSGEGAVLLPPTSERARQGTAELSTTGSDVSSAALAGTLLLGAALIVTIARRRRSLAAPQSRMDR